MCVDYIEGVLYSHSSGVHSQSVYVCVRVYVLECICVYVRVSVCHSICIISRAIMGEYGERGEWEL